MITLDGTLKENFHTNWSPNNKPALRVKNGEIISVKIPDSSTMQVKEDWTLKEMKTKMDMSLLDAAVGPIFVDGATKGDVLVVDILDIKIASWAWSSTERKAGLIKGRFDDNLTIWKIRDGSYAESSSDFLKGVRIPIHPFLGVMGVAPESGEFSIYPPHPFGGNIDNKLLTASSTLFLPVLTNGALLSVGDPHAAQGDGESGSTGLETNATAVLRLSVKTGHSIKFPRAISSQGEKQRLFVTMGVSNDLYEASKFAMEEMIDELSTRGYSGNEAYVLCSLAADLRISELVDEPNHVVSMTIPLHYLSRWT